MTAVGAEGAKVIQLDQVSKSYDGGATFAVRELSLTIDAGRFVALVGASGSGKTTALKLINRLVEPDSGEVRIERRPAREVPGPELRRRIGYVFQEIGLFPHMSVEENIAITPALLGWPKPEIAARTRELLELIELPADYGPRAPDALSGGQRQRVGLARALAARPKIVLMDEPFGALDPVTRDHLGEAYRALHDKLGLTTVMVTHDVQEAVLLADRIVVIKAGRILADDTPRGLLTDGHDPEVRALMDMPRRQAERVRALMDGGDG
jgi:osmoprotectant transport system ATP-binding protein